LNHLSIDRKVLIETLKNFLLYHLTSAEGCNPEKPLRDWIVAIEPLADEEDAAQMASELPVELLNKYAYEAYCFLSR
jgi:hypothetical protein